MSDLNAVRAARKREQEDAAREDNRVVAYASARPRTHEESAEIARLRDMMGRGL